MAFRIEQYLYHSVNGVNTIAINTGGSTVQFSITGTKTVSDALTEWASLATASGDVAGSYSFAYDDAQSRVVLARTDSGPGTFQYILEGSLAAALGFDFNASLSSASKTHTGTKQPGSICNPISIHHDPPEAAVEVSKKLRRLGRASIQAHYGATVTQCDILLTSAVADVVLAGPLLQGRVMLMQDHTQSDAYSVTDPGGNLDCYGHTITKIERIGYNEGHTRIQWVASLNE